MASDWDYAFVPWGADAFGYDSVGELVDVDVSVCSVDSGYPAEANEGYVAVLRVDEDAVSADSYVGGWCAPERLGPPAEYPCSFPCSLFYVRAFGL